MERPRDVLQARGKSEGGTNVTSAAGDSSSAKGRQETRLTSNLWVMAAICTEGEEEMRVGGEMRMSALGGKASKGTTRVPSSSSSSESGPQPTRARHPTARPPSEGSPVGQSRRSQE